MTAHHKAMSGRSRVTLLTDEVLAKSPWYQQHCNTALVLTTGLLLFEAEALWPESHYFLGSPLVLSTTPF